MPVWGYIYCGIFVFSCCFSIFDKNKLKRWYQPSGEALDCICAFLIFFIGFEIINFDNSEVVSTLCLIFNIAWSYHAHWHYLEYEKFKSDFHQSVIEEDNKMTLEHGGGYEPVYDFEQTEKEANHWYMGVIGILILVLIPYIYVFLKSVGAIGC